MQTVHIVFVLFLSVPWALACTCVRPSVKSFFFKADIVVKAKLISSTSRQLIGISGATPFPLEADFMFEVETVFKGCNVPSVIEAGTRIQETFTTPSGIPVASVNTCGTFSPSEETVILFLGSTLPAVLNSCTFAPLYRSLSPANREFLNSREVCCGGGCRCADGSELLDCTPRPCSTTEMPCEEAEKCVDNRCGDCTAEFFSSTNRPACSQPHLLGYAFRTKDEVVSSATTFSV
ncbi:Proteinase inhibitor I35b (TIMP) [Gracilaria domingensis]|nr:Proteinase inhibitor I35b (TIMP) [Gracilaria domingensis]